MLQARTTGLEELIEQFLAEEPFRVIRVILRDGKRFEIVGRFKVDMGWRRMTVLLSGKTADVWYEEMSWRTSLARRDR